jgi:hypothetical protein
VRVSEDGTPPCAFLVSIAPGGVPEVEWLSIARRIGGTPLTAVTIRLPLGRYLAESRKRAAVRVTRKPDGSPAIERAHYPQDGKREIPNELAEILEARNRARSRHGRTLSTEILNEAVTVYRRAVAEGRPPVQAVSDELHLAYPTASRRIQEARRRALLGPAMPRRGGEIQKEEDNG